MLVERDDRECLVLAAGLGLEPQPVDPGDPVGPDREDVVDLRAGHRRSVPAALWRGGLEGPPVLHRGTDGRARAADVEEVAVDPGDGARASAILAIGARAATAPGVEQVGPDPGLCEIDLDDVAHHPPGRRGGREPAVDDAGRHLHLGPRSPRTCSAPSGVGPGAVAPRPPAEPAPRSGAAQTRPARQPLVHRAPASPSARRSQAGGMGPQSVTQTQQCRAGSTRPSPDRYPFVDPLTGPNRRVPRRDDGMAVPPPMPREDPWPAGDAPPARCAPPSSEHWSRAARRRRAGRPPCRCARRGRGGPPADPAAAGGCVRCTSARPAAGPSSSTCRPGCGDGPGCRRCCCCTAAPRTRPGSRRRPGSPRRPTATASSWSSRNRRAATT